MKKKPQSAPSHIYDKKALKHLEEFFPEHWKLIPVIDKDSHIEYGQDMIVQLTDENNQLSGAEFRVQNKGTRQDVGANGLSLPIKVSTLNYLHDFPLPVMLHFYHIPTHKGYWIWLDDYFAQNERADWQEQDEVSILIPKSNILTVKAVKAIAKHANNMSGRQALLKHAEAQTAIDQDYSWTLEYTDRGVIVKQSPKQGNPLPLGLVLPPEIDHQLHEALGIGDSFQFGGFLEHLDGLPRWVAELFEGRFTEFTVIPQIEEKNLYTEILYFDKDGLQTFNSGLVHFKLKQAGQNYSLFEGLNLDGTITFTLIFDLRGTEQPVRDTVVSAGILKLKFAFDWTNRNPRVIAKFFELLDQTNRVAKAGLREMKSNIIIPIGPEKFALADISPEDELMRLLANALTTIADEMNMEILIPNREVTTEETYRAAGVADILLSGKHHTLIPPLPPINGNILEIKLRVLGASAVLGVLEDGITERVVPALSASQVVIFDQTLDLGPIEYVFPESRIGNEDELRKQIAQNPSEVAEYSLMLVIKPDISYSRFPAWPHQQS